MYYTYKQTKERLARFADGGCTDSGTAVNDAVERLMNTDQWRDLRRLMRIVVVRDVFALPQNVEAVLRYSVNGTPGRVYGLEYQFISGGPGDRDFGPGSIYPINTLSDLGSYYPVMFDPDPAYPCRIVAFTTNPLDAGKVITIYGCNEKNEQVTSTVPVQTWLDLTEGRVGSDETVAQRKTEAFFTSVSNVVLPDTLASYVSLYGVQTTASDMWFLGKYHPYVLVPTFRRYRITNGASSSDTSMITAEVKVRYTPLVADSDVLPFDSLHAVKLMLQAISFENSGDIQRAGAYQSMAVQELANVQASKEVSQGMPHMINFDANTALGRTRSGDVIL